MSLVYKTLLNQLRRFVPEPIDRYAPATGTSFEAYCVLPEVWWGVIPRPSSADQPVEIESLERCHESGVWLSNNFYISMIESSVSPCIGSTFVYRSMLEHAPRYLGKKFSVQQLHTVASLAIRELMDNERTIRLAPILRQIAWKTADLAIAFSSRDIVRFATALVQLELLLTTERLHDLEPDQRNELAALLLYCYAMLCITWKRLAKHAPPLFLLKQECLDSELWNRILASRGRWLSFRSKEWASASRMHRLLSRRSAATLLLVNLLCGMKIPGQVIHPADRFLQTGDADTLIPHLSVLSSVTLAERCVQSLRPLIPSALFQLEPEASNFFDNIVRDAAKRHSPIGFLVYADLVTSLYMSGFLWAYTDQLVQYVREHTYQLEMMAAEADSLDPQIMTKTLQAIDLAWPHHEQVRVAHIVQIIISSGTISSSCSVEDIAASLKRLYGRDGSLLGDRLRTKLFGQTCREFVGTLPFSAVIGAPLFKNILEHMGYIVSSFSLGSNLMLEEIIDRDKPTRGVGEPETPSALSKGWLKHHDAYLRLRASSATLWNEAESQIGKEATDLCNHMLDGDLGRQLDVTDILESRWSGDIRRVLIARRVILGMAKGKPDEGVRLCLMGFIKNKEDIGPGLKIYRESYRQYYHQVGLTSEVIKDPMGTDGLWPEERAWYEAYTPPK